MKSTVSSSARKPQKPNGKGKFGGATREYDTTETPKLALVDVRMPEVIA